MQKPFPHVYPVTIGATASNAKGADNRDLIFVDKKPYLVLAWENEGGDRVPSVMEGVSLEHLCIISDDPVHYRYTGPIGPENVPQTK